MKPHVLYVDAQMARLQELAAAQPRSYLLQDAAIGDNPELHVEALVSELNVVPVELRSARSKTGIEIVGCAVWSALDNGHI